MNTEKMTVHKALAELKIIDDRINKAINNAVFIEAVKNGTDKVNGIGVEDFKNDIKSGFQKVNDLINRRNAMKRAVVLSNATTKVTIGGKEYTVAEAIEMKNHGMDGKKTLLRHMSYEYSLANAKLNEYSGENLEQRANDYVQNILRSQGDSADKADSKQVQALHDSFVKANEFVMIDPLHIAEKIEELDKEIAEFEVDFDSALSVSNALTVIEFEY